MLPAVSIVLCLAIDLYQMKQTSPQVVITGILVPFLLDVVSFLTVDDLNSVDLDQKLCSNMTADMCTFC